jgi:hypothetical protein
LICDLAMYKLHKPVRVRVRVIVTSLRLSLYKYYECPANISSQ